MSKKTKYPLRMAAITNIFHIGTIKNPTNLDSHVWRGKWTVNPVNHWVASLEQNLNVENAMVYHLVVILHELTHVMSGILHGDENDETLPTCYWDDFLFKIVEEL